MVTTRTLESRVCGMFDRLSRGAPQLGSAAKIKIVADQLDIRKADAAAALLDRQEMELTFWRDGLSAEEVAANMRIGEDGDAKP